MYRLELALQSSEFDEELMLPALDLAGKPVATVPSRLGHDESNRPVTARDGLPARRRIANWYKRSPSSIGPTRAEIPDDARSRLKARR